MKPQTITERAERINQIEGLYRAAGTKITHEQASELADREAAANAADFLKSQRLDDFLPGNTKRA